MFVGVGASRVRDLFEQGKEKAPVLSSSTKLMLLVEEEVLEWVEGTMSDEQTLNQLLVEMDGFESSEDIILMAATNRPDVLIRHYYAMRFDRRVYVGKPDVKGREGILLVHTQKTPWMRWLISKLSQKVPLDLVVLTWQISSMKQLY